MKPGEIIPETGVLILTEGRDATSMMVINTGDRPVQVGSLSFFRSQYGPDFDRDAARKTIRHSGRYRGPIRARAIKKNQPNRLYRESGSPWF